MCHDLAQNRWACLTSLPLYKRNKAFLVCVTQMAFTVAMLAGVPTLAYSEISLSPEDILSKRGEWLVEHTLSMLVDREVHIDVAEPALLTITDQTSRDLISSVEIDYALTKRLEMFGYAVWDFPSIHRTVEVNNTTADSHFSEHNTDFRNVSVGLNYLAVQEDSHPAVLTTFSAVLLEREASISDEQVSLNRVSFRSFSVGATLYRQLDPVVLVGGFSYHFGLDQKIEETDFRPGDVAAWNMSAIFAANERLSISGGMSGAVSRSDKIMGNRVGPTSNDVSLTGGISLVLSPLWYTAVSIGGGLTDSAHDAVVTFRVGRRFKNNQIASPKGGEKTKK